MIVFADEINTGITIGRISFVIFSSDSYSYSDGMEVYMGLTDKEELTDMFAENWIPGTRTLVFSADSLYTGAVQGDVIEIQLDVPYYYPGEHNLLVETISGTGNWTSVYSWESGVQRNLASYYLSSPQGYLATETPYIVLEGEADLQPSTAGAIRIILGRPYR